jgi:ribonuclease P protein component
MGGRRLHGARMILYVAPGTRRASPAFVAGRRVGGAVKRNRARRVLREAWRRLGLGVSQSHIVFVAKGGVLGVTSRELEAEMRDLLGRLGVTAP